MKIYTRTGDDGTTGLIGGSRVPKSDAAIESYGTVDELNASLGICGVVADSTLAGLLRAIQGELFTIGSHLATPADKAGKVASLPQIRETWITRLETEIDTAESTLPPLRNFILPGGTELAARLHLSRTICRRAERLLVTLATQRPVEPIILTYINRLSDWLFVQARRANHLANIDDIPWLGG